LILLTAYALIAKCFINNIRGENWIFHVLCIHYRNGDSMEHQDICTVMQEQFEKFLSGSQKAPETIPTQNHIISSILRVDWSADWLNDDSWSSYNDDSDFITKPDQDSSLESEWPIWSSDEGMVPETMFHATTESNV
jgi:hypothetical protein